MFHDGALSSWVRYQNQQTHTSVLKFILHTHYTSYTFRPLCGYLQGGVLQRIDIWIFQYILLYPEWL
jgi:hypothetical protein